MIAVLCLVLSTALLAVAQHNPNCASGRHVAVHLFEWKWADIAAECERFLGPKGFCAVQVSPPNEHRVIYDPHRPWWERYQPVSYKLGSRSGTEEEFINMVQRCNNVNVRIYVDAVINHMGAGGSGTGSDGSSYDSGSLQFPGVPFGPNDFNAGEKCGTSSGNIENYGDANQVRNCRLVGLPDLDLSKDYVRGKVAEYLNRLIDIGVAGFRFDATKHMWPGDITAIVGQLSNLNKNYFPSGSKAFIYQEVIDLGSEPIKGTDYTYIGRVTEFKYGMYLGQGIRHENQLKWFSNFGEEWGMVNTNNALVFVDNHDNQRGHGAGGASILTFFDSRLYKIGNAFMLAHPYGFIRIMSSYYWDRNWQNGKDVNDWVGPPSVSDGSTVGVTINSDGSCGNGWMCEHRWRQIANMVSFRNVVTGTVMNNWWDNGNQQVAFSRGDKGFIAINNDRSHMSVTLQTGLESGEYCDVISGDYIDGRCTGKIITVDGSRQVSVSIGNSDEDPIIAIHAAAKLGGSQGVVTSGPIDTLPPPTGWERTVILINKQTSHGQDLFLRGGISHNVRPGCSEDVSGSDCAISIRYNSIGISAHYAKYNAWRLGDTKLDWYGKQSGQSDYQGMPAEGTPAVWTSNSPGSDGYQSQNVYGDHYWMLDVNIDCSQTEEGWFEIKGYLTNGAGWENDLYQAGSCTGNAGGLTPYYSKNHMGRCGYVNIFDFNSENCRIDNL